MDREPKISIILPIFNGRSFLGEAIHSIVAQSYSNWELILINDGSTDDSDIYVRSQILPLYGARVVYLTHPYNQGIASAYNTGIEQAQGKYIAFQEQDDISLPHRLAIQVEALQRLIIPFITSQVGWVDGKGKIYKHWPVGFTQSEEVFSPNKNLFARLLIHQTFFANTTTMIDRDLVATDDLYFDPVFRRSGQDWDLHIRFSQKYAMARMEKVLVLMRRHENHVSATTNKAHVFTDNRRILSKHLRFSRFLSDPRSFFVFLNAWSHEFLKEARHYRGIHGLLLGLLSLGIWPFNERAWESVGNLISFSRTKVLH